MPNYSHLAASRLLSEEQPSYFPLAFALSRDEPLKFNFDLRVLDDLHLPRAIGAPGREPSEDTPVTFADASQASAYLRQHLAAWDVPPEERPAGTSTSNSAPSQIGAPISKRALFASDCQSLASALRSGEDHLDANLDRVRLDRQVQICAFAAFGLCGVP